MRTILGGYNPSSKFTVDRRATDQNRDILPSTMKLIHDQGHLSAGAHQKSAQANRIGLQLNGSINDHCCRYLFAQVFYREAIIREDCFHQILPNIMNITVNCRQYDCALADPLFAFKKFFNMNDRGFHNLSGLQDEGQY